MTAPFRSWLPDSVESFITTHAAHYHALSVQDLDQELHRLVEMHEQHMDRECISLYAGTNIMNPRARGLLSSSLGSRPSLGWPGQTYNKGMRAAEQLEIMLAELLCRLFHARYAEIRAPSGSLANLFVYMATTRPGDTIMAFSDAAAGHATHHQQGAAGLYGLKTEIVPFDAARMDVDEAAFETQALALKPKLIIIAGSMCLFPYSLKRVRAVADQIGAWVMYDAAHMGGLIAGGAFQQPLAEGAHVMTGSTYKAFGGPPAGMILTNSADLAERIDRVAYPGLTANFDLSRTAAMILATLDLLEHGRDYAAMCIANARALAAALAEAGVPVHQAAGRGFTSSQHVAVQAVKYGGGDHASSVLEEANLLMSGIGLPIETVPGDYNGIRIGTQEVTRWGMQPDDMRVVAGLMADVLEKGRPAEAVRAEVVEFRRNFQTLHFIRL
jgi:glycine hydroxymethyltransferase